MENKELTEEIAIKVRDTVKCGLSSGLGKPIPGEMCVEAAVNYAYGLPHNDNPPCVGKAVRAFKIKLNDANWSSKEARAKGMIEISIAQLNSNKIDQKEFSNKVTIKIINEIISDLAAKYDSDLQSKLKVVVDLKEARDLCIELRRYAGYAAAYAAAAADDAAAGYAGYAGYAAGYAAAYAAAAADAAKKDSILVKAAKICLDVLKELGSEGCKYLYLLDKLTD